MAERTTRAGSEFAAQAPSSVRRADEGKKPVPAASVPAAVSPSVAAACSVGNPASSRKSRKARQESGVLKAGFATTGHPAANADAACSTIRPNGYAPTAATTGPRRVKAVRSPVGRLRFIGRTSPGSSAATQAPPRRAGLRPSRRAAACRLPGRQGSPARSAALQRARRRDRDRNTLIQPPSPVPEQAVGNRRRPFRVVASMRSGRFDLRQVVGTDHLEGRAGRRCVSRRHNVGNAERLSRYRRMRKRGAGCRALVVFPACQML